MLSTLLFITFTSDVTVIQTQALQARQKIVTGAVTYEFAFGHPPDSEGNIVWRAPLSRERIVFDARSGWRAFQERWMPGDSTMLNNGKSLIRRAPEGGTRERYIIRPDVCYSYIPDLLSDGSKFAISEMPCRDARLAIRTVIDPRKFGMMPRVYMDCPDYGIADFISPTAPVGLSLTPETLDGAEVLCVEYLHLGNRKVRYWVDPQRGMNVIRISEEGNHPDGSHFIVMSTSTLKYHPDADVWFPTTVVRQGNLIGKKPSTTCERILVIDAQLNLPVDPSQFEVSALEAHPHTSIASTLPATGPTQEWTGDKVAPIQDRPDRRASSKRGPEKSVRQFLTAIGAGLLLLAAFLYLVRRQRTTPSARR